jgi:Xaa-Pro aminopeptidase
MSKSETLLIVADSEHDANMLYATGMFVPDPFVFLRTAERDYMVMSDLEIDRARKQAPHCRLLPLSRYQRRLREEGVKQPGFAHIIPLVLQERRTRQVTVPHDFPLGLAVELQRRRIRVKPKPGAFFPEREEKSPAEIAKLRDALRITEAGMAAAMEVLRASKIGKNRRLIYHGAPLTSERVRSAIDTAIARLNAVASHTIVAGGDQGCDPHESGHGPLRANETIVIDIFPRSQATGFFGDLTRTVVRGRASEAVRKLYATVLAGQKLAQGKMRAGTPTSDVHRAVEQFFEAEGYRTGKHNGRMQGFFHGTGHGLGLEIHELPRMGANSAGILKPGHVITVEPGLYYPGLGGVRIEDVAVITRGAARNLTRCEKLLEI